MDSERWRRIGELFDGALEREGSERHAYLDEACAGDEGIRREVESLLSANDHASDFLTSPALVVAAQAVTGGSPESYVGRHLGRYDVLAPIGVGGMGEVYLAQDRRLGRQVAIKRLAALYTENPDALRRFKREAQVTSALNHPNIVTVYEVEEFDEAHLIVMELVEGQTLRDLLDSGPMEVVRAVEIALQVGSALMGAHVAGVVHRDIKPGNVMIRRDGYVKVLDFGLAKLRGPYPLTGPAAERSSSSHPGRMLGTPGYMAPERLSGKEVDGRADLFSLGVVLFEMVAGRPPFGGATPSEVAVSILREVPPQLGTLRSGIPSELERIVARAMEKAPERRYGSARELVTDLENLLIDLKSAAKRSRSV